MKKKILKRTIYEGESLPIWYGYAWTNYNIMARIAYPIPLNFLVRWSRELWFFLAKPRNENQEKMDLAVNSYNQGFEAGKKQNNEMWEKRIKEVVKEAYKIKKSV